MKKYYSKGMSKHESEFLKYIDEEHPLFTTKEIKGIKKFKHWPNLLINLKRKRWITQLEKGKYISNRIEANASLIGTILIQPSAIAYFSALNHYGLTEQISNIVYVQTLKQKKNKEIFNTQYKFVTVSPSKFFGLRKEWIGHYFYFITDLEKTIIDCFDLPEYAGGFLEVVKCFFAAHEKLDIEKLYLYALKSGNNTVIKRIAYLSEVLKLEKFEGFRSKAKKNLSQKYTLFNPMSPKIGKYMRKWRLLININEDEIINITRTIV